MPAVIELSDLDGANGFAIGGAGFEDRFGVSTSNAGDVNGDGIDDIVVSSLPADESPDLFGDVFVIFGTAAGFPARLSLSALDGSNGFVITPVGPSDSSGISVSDAGDVNGDGIDDLVIGASRVDGGSDPQLDGLGAAWVIFGASSFAAAFDLGSLNGANGFVIYGPEQSEGLGVSVSSVGDINADGLDDFVIGAPFAQSGGSTGRAYVVFGTSAGFPASFDLETLNGSNGFRVDGIEFHDWTGRSVGSAGDLNGDGIDDVAIGAPLAGHDGDSREGDTYIIFGKPSGFSASLDPSALDGTNGFRIHGVHIQEESGGRGAISPAGDVNGDGLDDLILGTNSAGRSYVVFGSSAGFDAVLELSSLDGSNGFVILDGAQQGASAGQSVSAGDFNGDGFDDLLIGAWSNDPHPGFSDGQAFVVFGNAAGFPAVFDLDALDGFNGMTINGLDPDDGQDEVGGAGWSVSSAGDVNADGIDDILVSAPVVDSGGVIDSGESYVIFGSLLFGPQPDARAFGDDLSLNMTDSGHITARLNAAGVATVRKNGALVSVDGDNTGLADISARGVTAATTSLTGNGAPNAIDGSDQADTIAGGGGADTLSGFDGDDRIVGAAGGDTLDGGAGAESLNGGGGRDILIGGAGNDTVAGGFGDDLFFFSPGDGADVFKDFVEGGATDEIRLLGFGPAFDSFAEVIASASASGPDLLIDFGGGDSLTLLDVSVANLTPGDFLFG